MRRQDRQVKDLESIKKIISACDVCRLGFIEKDSAYIVPMNFGFEWQNTNTLVLYFHCAKEGKKIDLLPYQNLVGFEMDTNHKLKTSDAPCGCSFLYQSIIGKGKIQVLKDNSQKTKALNLILQKYGKNNTAPFPALMLEKVTVLKLVALEYSGKAHNE